MAINMARVIGKMVRVRVIMEIGEKIRQMVKVFIYGQTGTNMKVIG